MTSKTDKNSAPSAPSTDTTKPLPGEADAKPQFNKEELLTIFDEMVFSGEYSEEVTLRKGKLKVTFRARTADDTMEISKDVESKNFTLISTLSEYRALMNLAYSLTSYAGKNLADTLTEERVKFIKKMPSVMVALLSNALSKFDQKIDAACAEGEENF